MSLRMERCRPQCGSSLLMPIVSLRVFIGHHHAQSSLLSLPCTCCTLCLNCPAALQCHLYLARPLGWVRPLAVHPTPARLAGLLLPPLSLDQISCLLWLNSKLPRAGLHLPCSPLCPLETRCLVWSLAQ